MSIGTDRQAARWVCVCISGILRATAILHTFVLLREREYMFRLFSANKVVRRLSVFMAEIANTQIIHSVRECTDSPTRHTHSQL